MKTSLHERPLDSWCAATVFLMFQVNHSEFNEIFVKKFLIFTTMFSKCDAHCRIDDSLFQKSLTALFSLQSVENEWSSSSEN